ncbi:hypothetical protein [Paracoccus cavernae]|uniref:hypothetical protein n=1 Tax=Paracoccus cavernae TaxID=1571207 RepID=UPI003644A179
MTTVEAASVFSGNSVQASLAWIAGEGLDPEQVVASADEILFAMFDMDIPHIPGWRRFCAVSTCRWRSARIPA